MLAEFFELVATSGNAPLRSLLHFAKRDANSQIKLNSEIGAARVIDVTANARNSWNVPKPTPVVWSNVGLRGQSK